MQNSRQRIEFWGLGKVASEAPMRLPAIVRKLSSVVLGPCLKIRSFGKSFDSESCGRLNSRAFSWLIGEARRWIPCTEGRMHSVEHIDMP